MTSKFFLCVLLGVANAIPDGYGPSGAASFTSSSFAAGGPVVPIVTDNRQAPDASGAYSFDFETGDGISRQEQGSPQGPEGAVTQTGGWSFTLPDGTPAVFRFVADENGFRVESDLLPTPPPLPAHAIEQIERARQEDAAAAASGNRGSYVDPSASESQFSAARRPSSFRPSAPSSQYGAPSASASQFASASAPAPFNALRPSSSRPSAPSSQYGAPSASSSQFASASAPAPFNALRPSSSRPSAPSSQYGAPSASSSPFASASAPAPFNVLRPSSSRPSTPSSQYGAPSAPAPQFAAAPSDEFASPSIPQPSRRPAPRPSAPSTQYGAPSENVAQFADPSY